MALDQQIKLHNQAKIRSLRGKLQWSGDLDKLREERPLNESRDTQR